MGPGWAWGVLALVFLDEVLAFCVVVNALAQTRGARHALDTLDP